VPGEADGGLDLKQSASGCAPARRRTEVAVMNFGGFLWLLIWSFFFVAYLMVLFHIFSDLFRDDMNGWLKAVWVIVLLVVPFLGALIYLIARGKGMAERQAGAVSQARAETDAYIRDVAGKSSPTDQIASAKALLDAGTISPEEFEELKRKALA
jgi:hypothetical protein